MECLTLLLPLVLSLFFLGQAHSTDKLHTKHKRQIFREQVLPLSGGKIPEGAFHSDRLALNRLNKEGIAIPDGVLLEARHRESHFKSYRNDPDINASIVKLVQRPDGRYAPPEGRYPFNNIVESTYIIRKPINSHGPFLPPQRVHATPLRIPARPFFPNEDDLFSFNHIESMFDVLTTFGPDISGANIWTGFGRLYHEIPNRILRQTTSLPRRVQDKSPGLLNPLQHKQSGPQVQNHLHPNPPQPGSGQQTHSVKKQQTNPQLLVTQPTNNPTLANQQSGPQLLLTAQQPRFQFQNKQPLGYQGSSQDYSNALPTLPGPVGYPSLTTIPKTRFTCSVSSETMHPDPETNCQVFHLCHRDGRKESFLCPQGSRFDPIKNQCTSWKNVACSPRR